MPPTTPTTAESGDDRLRLPDPAGPPQPSADHPKAAFYKLPSGCCAGHEEPAAANSGRYL
jgi:hypothetical protein